MFREWHLRRWLRVLKSRSARRRQKACERLGSLGDARAIEPLAELLGDGQVGVRCAVCAALGGIRDRRSVPPLLSALDDAEAAARSAAAEALGALRDPRALDHLIGLLDDDDWEVHVAVCHALGALGENRAFWALVKHLGDDNPRVRQAALDCLDSPDILLPPCEGSLCRECLARFTKEGVWFDERLVQYAVCRLCGDARHALLGVREVVCALDRPPRPAHAEDGLVRANWFKEEKLFDFDRVEIAMATDDEVERFCIRVANDGDPERAGRHKRIPCRVAPRCRLRDNTLNLLAGTFSELTVAAEPGAPNGSHGR